MLYQFWLVFAVLAVAIVLFDKYYCMLRDISKAKSHQPYSWSRVQLAWWTLLILSCFITVFWVKGTAPTLHSSTIILLGISGATMAMARTIDVSDIERRGMRRHQDDFGKDFFLDILSDETGVSIHRFQTVVFNAVFGAWFIYAFLHNLASNSCSLYASMPEWLDGCGKSPVDYLIPPISQNNLILLGVSSATYAALKTTENRSAAAQVKNKEADAATQDTYQDPASPFTPVVPGQVPEQGVIYH